MKRVSVVIPFGPHENQWRGLFHDLRQLPVESEIIIVFHEEVSKSQPARCVFRGPASKVLQRYLPDGMHSDGDLQLIRNLDERRLILVASASGRATEMNTGSRFTSGEHLWFLHADSRFTDETVPSLEQSLHQEPDALHYFRLTFLPDASNRMIQVNQWCARFRSERFNVPFGDQGFCISAGNFQRAGEYPENVPYGEDHLFVWHARQAGIQLRCTGTELLTSARKYNQAGWLRLTIRYQAIWIRQAIPEYIRLHLSGYNR